MIQHSIDPPTRYDPMPLWEQYLQFFKTLPEHDPSVRCEIQKS